MPAGWSAMGPVGHDVTPAALHEGLSCVREIRERVGSRIDVMIEGREALDAFTNLAGVLRLHGVRQLLVPLPAESAACAMLRPFAEEIVDLNFVVKCLDDSGPVPPGPLFFDIRH